MPNRGTAAGAAPGSGGVKESGGGEEPARQQRQRWWLRGQTSLYNQPVMLLRAGCVSFFAKTPTLFVYCFNKRFSTNKPTHLLTTAAAALIREPSSSKLSKKARYDSPEGKLRGKLDTCSKNGDLAEALRLYDAARANGIPLSQHHYNVLLYLCSSCNGNGNVSEKLDKVLVKLGLERGFEIFKQMGIHKVAPNEATFTSLARLALAKEDPEMAFDLVKKMKGCGVMPKLRSYGPGLFGFCSKGMADKAYEVDAHMRECGVLAEESELVALLKVSVEAKRDDRVYEMMHRLRAAVRQVAEETAGVVEDWFMSERAVKVGRVSWDVEKVREGVVKGGGGWHGQGWLGSGNWRVARTHMDEKGVCQSCGEKLVCIDIDPKEAENFATSLTSLACQKEVKGDFRRFQDVWEVGHRYSLVSACKSDLYFYGLRLQISNNELKLSPLIQKWLQQHGPFDAVVDGANVGLVNQHDFNFFQLNSVVRQLQRMSPSKRLPLVVLHKSRVTGGPAQYDKNKKLLESWNKSGALYATPRGSNDDWYWLFAAVSCNCLLVTNDEMRDHLFQLLGTNFFPRWKEKHQVRLATSNGRPELRMPPPYSIVIQESEQGSWHVPTLIGDDLETPRQWICATRARDASSRCL
ncbi:hypothetical protein RHSIM_Rhsim05G0111800 [Rhododendron simsii]|uniref:ribonuclease P n=1 Tax=Rhododendron simsii TaxID=118357 RepID=A0A834H1S7_RHOSS|nr:hypothetical protein RHSIM_Rhsim05G0111800 [Rhododendron simsii]